MPLVLGPQAALDRLREFLIASGFTEPAVLQRLGIGRLSDANNLVAGQPPEDLLDVLIYLFLLGQSVPREALGSAGPIFTDLGLIVHDEGLCSADVTLYPTNGVYIASDRTRGRELPEASSERVFSAISANTEEFLSILPTAPCPAFLELCAGAGAAAVIAASRYATQAFAFDISERSRLFAEFNRRLNGLSNVTVSRGDLYQPARRRTFDRIAAHPPYVPSLRAAQVFRDGGSDGETLTRRVIEGLPAHLHPGGRFYGLALMAQYADQSIESRIRGWLKEAHFEFDLAVVTRAELTPASVVLENWSPRHAEQGDLSRWQSVLRRLRIESFRYVMLILERHAHPRHAVSLVRRTAAPRFDPRPVERSFAVAQAPWPLPLPLRAVPGIQVSTRAPLDDPQNREYTYLVASPFQIEFRGSHTTAEVLRSGQGPGDEVRALLAAGLLDPQPSVVDASPAQLPVLTELLREYAAGVGSTLCFESFEKELASLTDVYSHLLLALDVTGPVGAAALRPLGSGAGEMKRLYVRPAARGRRIGELLVNAVVERARAAGYRRLLLDTLPTMATAQALYRALGFREIPPYTAQPVEGACHMELILDCGPADQAFRDGLTHAREGRLAEAFTALEKAVELDPGHAAACKELARLSRLTNEVRAFTNWCHEAIRLAPHDPEPHRMLAEALAAAGRHEEAAEEEAIALRLTPSP